MEKDKALENWKIKVWHVKNRNYKKENRGNEEEITQEVIEENFPDLRDEFSDWKDCQWTLGTDLELQ